MGMCYVGKATKIFIFIVIAMIVTGLVLGFRLFHHVTHNSVKSPAQTNDPYPLPVTSTPVTLPPPTVQQSPETPDAGSNPSPPPPPPPQVLVPPPPPPQDFVPPPSPVIVVTTAPPPVFSPPSPVGTPGPVQALMV